MIHDTEGTMGTQTQPPLTPAQATRIIDPAHSDSPVLARLEAFCRERPWTAIALGVALGGLLRTLLARR